MRDRHITHGTNEEAGTKFPAILSNGQGSLGHRNNQNHSTIRKNNVGFSNGSFAIKWWSGI
jgi:hypothetical protein